LTGPCCSFRISSNWCKWFCWITGCHI
jgi:hypothetical protein